MRGGGLLRIGFRESFPYINPIIYIGMRLNKFLMAVAALAVVGCAEPKDKLGVQMGESTNVELSIEIPAIDTRAGATNSALGGLSNVDWSVYDLRYKVAVYQDEEVAFSDTFYAEEGYAGLNHSVALTKGRDYELYVWADFVKIQGEDLHYTTDDIRNISLNGSYAVNDESRDAYAYYGTFSTAEGAQSSVNAVLTRPFAKLRVVTTDADKLSFDKQIGSIVVSYIDGGVPSSYALVDGSLGADATVSDVEAEVVAYADDAANECTLLTDYIFAPTTGQGAVKVSLTVKDTDGNVIYTIPTKELPVEKNKLTSGKGAALTGGTTLNISIDGTIGDGGTVDL